MYKDRDLWNADRLAEWNKKKPAAQRLTGEISKKGGKLYSISVLVDDHDRMKAELNVWTVTSLRKFKKTSTFGVIEKVRDVRLFVTQDGSYDLMKEIVSCTGEVDKEVLDSALFSTPKKAVDFETKFIANRLKWLKLRPPSTPDTEGVDGYFTVEKYERQTVAVGRLKKRLFK